MTILLRKQKNTQLPLEEHGGKTVLTVMSLTVVSR